jgi:hypothetical protein
MGSWERGRNGALSKHGVPRLQAERLPAAAELLRAREQYLKAKTEEETRSALESRNRALQLMADFVARKIVPKEFLQE